MIEGGKIRIEARKENAWKEEKEKDKSKTKNDNIKYITMMS